MSASVSYADYGGTAAENYERHFVPVILAPLAADLLQTAALRPGEHVVDVACGTGVVARLAAQHVGETGRVVAIDPNPGMLEVARSLPTAPGASIEWRLGSAEALPLADESFDFVLCQLGLMFFPDQPAGLRELRRVLAPGGRIVVNVPGRMPRMFEMFAEALQRNVSPDAARFVGGVFSLGEPNHVEELLKEAGFGEIDVRTPTRTLLLPPPADFLWQYIHSTPLGPVVDAADEGARQGLEHDVVTGWQEFVEHGALTLRLPVIVVAAQV